MTTSTLNFGLIGRCACGALGRRRATFADEPVCAGCLPNRSSFLHAPSGGLSMVGRLTPAQRRARVAWLRGSFEREAELQTQHDTFVACAVGAGA